MIKGKFVCLLLLISSSLVIQAENVSISGVVKKTGTTTGIAGVKVVLAKKSTLSAVTDADGKFTLSGSTPIQQINPELQSFHFNLRGNTIVFSPISQNVTGNIEIISSNGKMIFSTTISLDKNSIHSLSLPPIGSGINIMRITIGEKSVSRTLVCMGDDLFMEDGSKSEHNIGSFVVMKQAAAAVVDTLLVSKSGYTTKKVPIDGYTKQNMAIELDSGEVVGGKCTRESLKAIVDKYIEAQKAGDPTMMPLAENVKVKVNAKDTSLEKSILKQALKIDFNLSIYDVDSCRTFTEVIVANSTPQYVIGTRLRVKDEKITEVVMILTQKEDWGFNATNYLKYAKPQNWYVLSEAERISRDKLIDAGNQYLDIFNGDDEGLPWGAPCFRIEGGMSTLGADTTADWCKTTSSQVLQYNNTKPFLIGNRDFIVDVDLGTVNVFCSFCKLDSHMFRLIKGKYRYVHTLTIGCN
jgi:hypothetical protein